MTSAGVYQIVFFFAVILALTKPLGAFMAACSTASGPSSTRCSGRSSARSTGSAACERTLEQRWTQYAGSLLAFSVVKFAVTYTIQRFQGVLPLNPQGFGTPRAPAGATP